MKPATVYLVPAQLADDGYNALPEYLTGCIRSCQVFFTENERSTRRYFKALWKAKLPGQDIVIDEHEWVNMEAADAVPLFREHLAKGSVIGLVSEAGCPGVADPGQRFVALAQEAGATVKPLVGPSSILLALMASGMSGQQFRFVGYLPVEAAQRAKAIRELENDSARHHSTQLCIETPYRNNQLLEAFLQNAKPGTRLCIAANITGEKEMIRTRTIAEWKKAPPDLHKQPVIFCLSATAEPLT